MSLNSVQQLNNAQWKKLEVLNYSKKSILDFLSEGSVLDLGCGDGLLLEEIARKRSDKIVGADSSQVAIDIAKGRGVDAEVLDILEPLPFKEGSFDNVLLIDVLEHIFTPEKVLAEAARISKRYVYISVPNFVSLPARLQVLLGRVPENNTPRDAHAYWFTWPVFKKMISNCGLVMAEEKNNTFWMEKPILGFFTRRLLFLWPNLFALSFVVKLKKK